MGSSFARTTDHHENFIGDIFSRQTTPVVVTIDAFERSEQTEAARFLSATEFRNRFVALQGDDFNTTRQLVSDLKTITCDITVVIPTTAGSENEEANENQLRKSILCAGSLSHSRAPDKNTRQLSRQIPFGLWQVLMLAPAYLRFGMRFRCVQDCPFQNRTPAFNVKLCGPGKSPLIRVCDCLPAYADSKQQAQIRRWSIAFEPNLHCHVLMFKTRTQQPNIPQPGIDYPLNCRLTL